MGEFKESSQRREELLEYRNRLSADELNSDCARDIETLRTMRRRQPFLLLRWMIVIEGKHHD
jgi:hypothetical protein